MNRFLRTERRRLRWAFAVAAAAGTIAGAGIAFPVAAQTAAPTAQAAVSPERRVIRAPELDPAQTRNAAPTADTAGAEPNAGELLPTALPDPVTRIEQVRQGRRVTEVVISPGGYRHSYRMAAREPRSPQGPSDLGSGLSVPRFIRVQF